MVRSLFTYSYYQVGCLIASLVLPRWLSTLCRPLSTLFLSLFHTTTLQVISALTSNKKLIAVLTYIWGDYGEPPGTSLPSCLNARTRQSQPLNQTPRFAAILRCLRNPNP